jgi:hypothetical protein
MVPTMPELDVSAWPLVVVRADEKLDAEAATHLVADLSDIVDGARDSGERLGLVLDTERADRAAREIVQAWWAERSADLGAAFAAGASVVAAATVDRNRAFMAEHPEVYPFPTWCAATEEECAAWVRERM